MVFARHRPPPDLDLPPGATAEDAIRATASSPLRVLPSLIPGAGNGLFAATAFPAGHVLEKCTYGGDVLTFMEARRVARKDYLMALHFNVHVDATSRVGYLARFINDNLSSDGEKRNVRFVKDPEARLARVRTLRAIQPGEELYAEYGEGYWRRRRRLELEEGSREGTAADADEVST